MKILDIEVTIGERKLISSGSVIIDKKNPLLLKLGNIFAKFEINNLSNENPVVNITPDNATLTMVHKINGNIPYQPLSWFSGNANYIGTSDGIPIFLSWKISRLHKDLLENIQIDYSIYQGNNVSKEKQ